jgi:hypothetical protein
MKQKTKLLLTLVAGFALWATPRASQAQLLYSENFDADLNIAGTWVTNASGGSNIVDLYFDYSTVGIPTAPNSTGGSTRGVKIAANLGIPLGANGVFPNGISVSPTDFTLPVETNFVIYCDFWINFNGPAPAGGSGSTQHGGVGFGTAGTSPQVIGSADSIFCVVDGEGQSASDFRVYTRAVPTSLQIASGVYVAGSRDSAAAYHATNFPGQTAPPAQLASYPQQTGTTSAGSIGWKWREFKIEKIGPIATWSIDGIPIANIDTATNGLGGTSAYAGQYLLFTHSDGFTAASTNSKAEFLSFSLFDNLRVSNVVANVVTITVPTPGASESGPSPAEFTFTRSIVGGALTVNYTISGTATNGVDYTNALGGSLSGSITFAAGQATTNLAIIPIDDGITEAIETVTLSSKAGVGYVGVGAATATIGDNDPALLIVSADARTMYERHTNDTCSVVITRWGDLSTQLFMDATNFTYAGGGVLDTDFVVNSNLFPILLDANAVTTTNNLISPLDNSAYTGNKSVVVGLSASVDFAVATSNAVLSILDDEHPAAVVLYTNALTSVDDATNWNVTYANGDIATLGATDFEASFGYDLTANVSGGGVIGLPPGGAINALRATVNKNVASNAGLNLYPTNIAFSGDLAVRFNLNIVNDTAAGTTQGPLFGINHTGLQTNWWAGSAVVSGGPWAMDGLFYWISPDGGAAAGDYILRTGAGGALPNGGFTTVATANLDDFTKAFKNPVPYSGYAGAGLIGNDPPAFAADTSTWTDVEITQLGRIVSLYLNKTLVIRYTNTTTFTNGTIMLGYSDPFSSVGEAAGAAYFANLSVVRLSPPIITDITRSGSNVTIDFTSNDGTDNASTFALQAAAVVTGPYADVAGVLSHPQEVVHSPPGACCAWCPRRLF